MLLRATKALLVRAWHAAVRMVLHSGALLVPCPNESRSCCAPLLPPLGCREESAGMFRFSYSQYMQHAFPRDDLRPISCRGKDSQGGEGSAGS